MAKRRTYDWDSIKADYEIGKSNAYLHKEYDVPYNALSNKIKRDKWVVCEQADTTIKDFKKSCEQVVNTICEVDEPIADAMVSEINIELQLMSKRSELANGSLNILSDVVELTAMNLTKHREAKEELKPHELKAYADIGKTIEGVAVPRSGTQVNVQQNNTTEIKQIEVKFIE